jgi:hypothetical protein
MKPSTDEVPLQNNLTNNHISKINIPIKLHISWEDLLAKKTACPLQNLKCSLLLILYVCYIHLVIICPSGTQSGAWKSKIFHDNNDQQWGPRINTGFEACGKGILYIPPPTKVTLVDVKVLICEQRNPHIDLVSFLGPPYYTALHIVKFCLTSLCITVTCRPVAAQWL